MNNLDDTPPPAISVAQRGARRGPVGSGVVGDEIWYLGDEKNEWVFVYE